MKKWLALVLAAGAVLLLGVLINRYLIPAAPQPAAAAQQPVGPVSTAPARARTISVSGSADVMVVPDEVTLNLGVETSDPVLDTARNTCETVIKSVMDLAKEMGIDPKYLQSGFVHIDPRYQDSYTQRSFIGYYVTKTLTVNLKDISKFETLLGRALKLGVTHVYGVEFRTSELRKYRDQARALALKAAREKADAMAKELGAAAGDPLSIREEQNSWYSGYSSWWGWGGAGSASQNVVQNSPSVAGVSDLPLAPGQIAVSAQVAVDFELK